MASNTYRLLGDDKAWTNGDLVGVLSAYVFESRLISSVIGELSENLPLKLPARYSTRILLFFQTIYGSTKQIPGAEPGEPSTATESGVCELVLVRT